MLKTNTSRIFALIMVITTLLSATPLNVSAADAPSSWAQASVDRAKALGLVTADLTNGYQAATTRAEFCRAAVNFLRKYGYDVDSVAPKLFEDTADKDIGIAAALKITSGTNTAGTQFTPNRKLTREEAATMLNNVLAVIGIRTNTPNSSWNDRYSISDWAVQSASNMYNYGVISGTSATKLVFSPKTPYTHEQSIATLLRLWECFPKSIESSVSIGRKYDMNDINVCKYPIYATAKSASAFKAGMATLDIVGWRSASETIKIQSNDDPDYMIDGKTFYDWRMRAIKTWVDKYLAANSLTYKDKTDYEKTAIIKKIDEDGTLEEFINLWRPSFKFTTGDCGPRAEALNFLMIALDFELFDSVGCTVQLAHATNAYWDSTVGAIRFIDAPGNGWGVWNLFIDEIDERGMILDKYGDEQTPTQPTKPSAPPEQSPTPTPSPDNAGNSGAKDKLVDSKINEVINKYITAGMSDLDKERIAHDWILLNTVYDDKGNAKTENNEHTAYGAIIEGRAVCDGFSKAFKAFMDKLGIECEITYGSSHSWNKVKIGGVWYEVDLTFDNRDDVDYNWTDWENQIMEPYGNYFDLNKNGVYDVMSEAAVDNWAISYQYFNRSTAVFDGFKHPKATGGSMQSCTTDMGFGNVLRAKTLSGYLAVEHSKIDDILRSPDLYTQYDLPKEQILNELKQLGVDTGKLADDDYTLYTGHAILTNIAKLFQSAGISLDFKYVYGNEYQYEKYLIEREYEKNMVAHNPNTAVLSDFSGKLGVIAIGYNADYGRQYANLLQTDIAPLGHGDEEAERLAVFFIPNRARLTAVISIGSK
ncbi:hypothetical protein FACS189490_06000 [Clostridia bacterium]|nr:hypothetical protein FACS189490_06000 [Clostridia bacterium]